MYSKNIIRLLVIVFISVSCNVQKPLHATEKYPVIDNDAAMKQQLFTLSNWGKWGNNDQLGTLNYISSATVLAAKKEIRTGEVVSLARQVNLLQTPGVRNPKYEMLKDEGGCRDYAGAIWHGFAQTHIDALCHAFTEDKKLYNGFSTDSITDKGAKVLGIENIAAKGIIGRGVLLDIAFLKGKALEAGTAITIEDLENAASKQGVKLQKGDILWVRTGANWQNTREKRAGLHPSCVTWLKAKQIALLGSDGDNDVFPIQGFENYNIHSVAIPYLGLSLIDNADLDKLSETCKKYNRWSFFITIAPWNFEGLTSAPINPVAIF